MNYLNEESSKFKNKQSFLEIIEKVLKTKGWQGLYLIHIVNLYLYLQIIHSIDIQAAYYGNPEIVQYLLDYHEMFNFSSDVKDNYGILLRFKNNK